MDEHIQKLLKFINNNDPTNRLNYLSQIDEDIKHVWQRAQNRPKWKKIKSSKDVIKLIEIFERTVLCSPSDIRKRNLCKHEMLIALYEALHGLKRWCNSITAIPILRNPNFPMITESEVEQLIHHLQTLMQKI